MRIHSLTIDNVRAIEHLEITGLPDTGVVVVHGDNEQGKSTILDALDAVLNHRHSSGKGEVKQLAPVHRDEAPEVTARLSVGPVELTIRKRWLKKKSAELTVHAPSRGNYTGAEADLKLEEILGEHLDKNLIEALFLRQGTFAEAVKAAGIPSLQRALAGEQGEEAVDATEDDALMAAVEKEYGRFFTNTGKENKALINSRRDRDKAAEELADAEKQLRDLQSYVDQVDRLEQSRDGDVADLPAAREQLEEAEAALVAARQAESGAAVVRGEVERVRQAVTAAQRQLAERSELEEEAAELSSAEAALATRLTQAKEKAEQQAAQVATLGKLWEEAKQRRAAAVDSVKAARKMLEVLENAAARDELAGVVEKLDALDENIASVRARAAGKQVTDRDVRAVEQAVQEVEVARRFRDMAVPHLELTSAGEATVSVNGEPATVGQSLRVDMREGTELTIGEVTATYHAGNSTDASADETVERAEAALADQLAELGCADLDQVRQLREEARSTEQGMARLVEQRTDLLAGRSADDIRARAANLAELLQDTDIPDSDLSAARAEVLAAETARDDADQEVDKAEGSLSTWRDAGAERDLVRVQADHDNTAERAVIVAGKLAALEEGQPKEELTAQLKEADEQLATAEEKLRVAEVEVAQADPSGKEAAVDATLARVDSLTARIKKAEVELARLDGYITQAAGAAERVELARSDDEAMRRQLASLERKANAAARLREVLRRHRDQARARYAQPFVDELTSLAKTVFGPDVAFDLTENLTIRDRTVGGATVPLASLSGGAKEQLAILTRFAIASLISGEGTGQVGVPVIVDDALGSTDPRRLQRMGQLFSQMGKETQVIVLTCFPQRFDWVNPKTEYSITQLKGAR
ncbi:AAA family ATPase [Corynebacterium doosanense]|uniref:DNA repair protein n=1 Tax=Corynebacterium doosanense CAU 212 = DSM 45436 TaxID=558173 RepID=A0A097IFA0_9CORY|nr:AAA family ATPase [Corynebacterium doosanense]AIT60816.1 DNA repair protein [Corynebacterium doosanense CAU 212 = DSM 45436]